eukprot:2270712-Rhodomonas_salina.1
MEVNSTTVYARAARCAVVMLRMVLPSSTACAVLMQCKVLPRQTCTAPGQPTPYIMLRSDAVVRDYAYRARALVVKRCVSGTRIGGTEATRIIYAYRDRVMCISYAYRARGQGY